MDLPKILKHLETGLDHYIVDGIKEEEVTADKDIIASTVLVTKQDLTLLVEYLKRLLPSEFPVCSHKDCKSVGEICDYCGENVCIDHYTNLHNIRCAGGCGERECMGDHPGQPVYPNDNWELNADSRYECYECRTSVRRLLARK